MLNKRIFVGLIIACALLTPLALAGNNGVPVFLDANLSVSGDVPKGYPVTITGTSNGTTLPIAIWVFGNDFGSWYDAQPDKNGNFALVLYNQMTDIYPVGKYRVIVQHPGENGQYDVYLIKGKANIRSDNHAVPINHLILPYGMSAFRGDDAVWALKDALSKTDDLSKELTFTFITPTTTPTATPTPNQTAVPTTTVTTTVTTATTKAPTPTPAPTTTEPSVEPKVTVTAVATNDINERFAAIDKKFESQEERLDQQEGILESILAFLKSIFNWE